MASTGSAHEYATHTYLFSYVCKEDEPTFRLHSDSIRSNAYNVYFSRITCVRRNYKPVKQKTQLTSNRHLPGIHKQRMPPHTDHVQSLLKVAIHGGGGATRPDLGRAVQFEGHWIARPNPGRQRAGGAAGAGAEWGSNRSAESGNRGARKLW